jgi:high-affinity Fe2+/Pb2+ permease
MKKQGDINCYDAIGAAAIALAVVLGAVVGSLITLLITWLFRARSANGRASQELKHA